MYFQYVRNPKGFCDERKFVMQYAPSQRLRIEAAIHYVAESLLAGNKYFITDSTNKTATICAAPLGVLLYLWIRKKTKE